jgi:hypothetical protein
MPFPAATRERQRSRKDVAYRNSRIQRLVTASRRLADTVSDVRLSDVRVAAAITAARTEIDEVAAILRRESQE